MSKNKITIYAGSQASDIKGKEEADVFRKEDHSDHTNRRQRLIIPFCQNH
jgi:hypothetical protein